MMMRTEARKKRKLEIALACTSDSPTAVLRVQDVLEICGCNVFDFLTVKEVALTAEISKAWQQLSSIEFDRRSEKWVQETSRAWRWRDKNKYELHDDESILDISADDLPDEKIALDCLDDYWKDNFDRPTDLLREVAQWSGGWPQFLHAREEGPKPQPTFKRGKQIEFTTFGSDRHDGISVTSTTPFALLYDMRCDCRHVWSALQPVEEEDIGRAVIYGDDDMPGLCMHPVSSNTLGDKSDSTIIYPVDHDTRHPKLLFSTDLDDTRNWEITVSIVSPICSETRLFRVPLAPPRVFLGTSGDDFMGLRDLLEWEKDAGYEEDDEDIPLRRENAQNSRSDGWYHEYDLTSDPRPDKTLRQCQITWYEDDPVVKGLREDGTIQPFQRIQAGCTYWLDRRNPTRERLHLNMDFWFEDAVCTDMILNPRPPKC